MKRIVISGACGFLGRNIIQTTMAQGVSVLALPTFPERLADIPVEIVQIDRFLQGNVHLTKDDVFINCLFPTNNADGYRMADGLHVVYQTIRTARESGVGAFINISSQSVYSSKRTAPATEKDALCLETLYAVGKYSSEAYANQVFRDKPHTNLRMASLIGPNSDGRISNRFVKQVISGKDIHIVADSQVFGFLDVRDAAAGITKYALAAQNVWEEVLNLGSGHAYSLREIAECVVRVGSEFGYHSSVVIGESIGDMRNSELDGSKLEQLLDWKAMIPMEQTIRDAYIHYMKGNGEQQ